jgi:hypothetical protein
LHQSRRCLADAAFLSLLFVPALQEGEFRRRGMERDGPAMHPLDFALVGQGFEIAAGSRFADGELLDNLGHADALALGDQLQELDLSVGAGDEVVLHIYPHTVINNQIMS